MSVIAAFHCTNIAAILQPKSLRVSKVLVQSSSRIRRSCAPRNLFSKSVAASSADRAPLPESFPSKLEGVLFDMDGTLSDSESLHFKAYQQVFARLPAWADNHEPMTRDYYNKNLGTALTALEVLATKPGGKTKLGALSQVLPHASLHERERICQELEDEFKRLASSDWSCLPGVYPFLDLLDAHAVPAGLVTNAPPSEMDYALAALELQGRFATRVPSVECKAGKPSPEPYLEALRRLGLDASVSIAFEDSPAGIESAAAAGIYTVGVSTSREPQELVALGASMTVADFQDAALLAAVGRALGLANPPPGLS